MRSMLNTGAAAGASSSSALPAHRRQVAGSASGHSRLPSVSAPHQHRASPLRLASSEACGGEFFSLGRHPPPHMSSARVTTGRRMVPRCLACAEQSLVGGNTILQNKVYEHQFLTSLAKILESTLIILLSQHLNYEREARIRKQLLDPELPPSTYGTAWVAMVPLRGFPQTPCFPQCVEWILQNQQDDGSWGTSEPVLLNAKCILLSTLACVIALKKWNVGDEHVRRGLHFIGRNFSIAMDEQTPTPIGFNIIFPGMISLAMGMGLDFHVRQTDLDKILYIRQLELKSFADDKSYGRKAYTAYVAEGLGNMMDWNEVMKFQRKNGSLFNSPSTTAAALIYYYDDKALQYLKSLLSKSGCAVPAVYPTNVSCQLKMVDSLEKIGISRHFSNEIKSILDMTYSLWIQRDDEIMMDVTTCAMAFRILRMKGYDVSSDELSHVAEAADFHNSFQGYVNDTKSLLELYKASNASVSKNEPILDNISDWSGNLLMKQLCSHGAQKVPLFGEVEYVLKFPFYATMERLEHKRNIENFDARGQMLKTEYLPCHVNKDLLALAIEDFRFSQFIYQGELLHLESWVKGNRLDQLRFARQKQAYCYLAASATIFPPELSDTRISWAKNAILTTIVDDFFDIEGSKEELENLVTLVEMWDEHHKLEFRSETVQIVFCAIYTTVNQLAVMASVVQNRDVRKHLIELWIYTLRSMMTEAEWVRSQYVPTFDEYMTNARYSFALGPIVLPSLYFLGQELPRCIVEDQEYNELFSLMSTCCRLLNDIQGFEREENQGKVNSVSLYILDSGGFLSTEAAKKAIHETIASARRDLLRLVLREDSVIPRPCKEMFWKMCKINHLFYSHSDGYSSSKEMMSTVNAVIHDPLKLQIINPYLAIKSANKDFLNDHVISSEETYCVV